MCTVIAEDSHVIMIEFKNLPVEASVQRENQIAFRFSRVILLKSLDFVFNPQ